jgi:C4-dicarboxylate transporter, DctM subunit
MSLTVIGIIAFVFILGLVFLNVPVAFSLIIVGFVGLVAIIGFEPALTGIAIISFEQTSNYDLAVIPLFMLMGEFVSRGNIGRDAYDMARAWLGHMRGGLAIATTVACGMFAAVCGSSTASAVAMGQITYPEMKRSNYDDKLTTGTIAAGGTMGILIPPSTALIVLGILTQVSIGKLFIAGIIPGITQIIFYVVTIAIICRIHPDLGPASARTTLRKKVSSLTSPWPVILLFLLVIGGLYGGIFTPSEAGAIGVFGALIINLVRRQFTSRNLAACLMGAAKISAMIMALIVGSFIFNKFLAVTRITFVISDYIVGLGLSSLVVLIIILIIYIILGCFFDIYAIIVLTIPIFFPVITMLHVDPIWFCVLTVRVMEMGMITPPFGMNAFVLAGVVNLPVSTIFRGVIPFIISDFFNLALLIAMPSLSTYLPDLMITSRN